MSLISKREIQIGEELVYDYGSKYTGGLECLCGSRLCRKYIHEEEDGVKDSIVKMDGNGDECSDEERRRKRRK